MQRTTATCILNSIKQMRGVSKSCWYRLLRSQGLRLYSSRSRSVKSIINEEFPDLETEKSSEWVKHQMDQDVSWFTKFKESRGFLGSLKYYPATLQKSGLRMYMCCEMAVQYNSLFRALTLPDTFETWHRLVGLHIWLCMVRLQQEGRNGRVCVAQVLQNFVTDTTERKTEVEKVMGMTLNKKALQKLHVHFMENILHLDEGLLGNDMHLAGALWRTVFYSDEDVDLKELELMVQYVRKQVAHLDTYTSKDVLRGGLVAFVSLHDHSIADSVFTSLERIEEKHPSD